MESIQNKKKYKFNKKENIYSKMLIIIYIGSDIMDRIEYKKLTQAEPGTGWQGGQTLVTLTAGACLLALVIALKNFLDVPTERLTTDLVLSICILGGLATSYPLVTRRRTDSVISHPGLWIVGIVTVTMTIIVLHATGLPGLLP
jgi:hypothetical protein